MRTPREKAKGLAVSELPSIILKSYLCLPWLDFSMCITNGMLHFCTKHPWVVNVFFPRPRRTHGETRNLTNLRTLPPDGWSTKCSVPPQTLSNSEGVTMECRYFIAATSRLAIFFPIS